MHKNFLRLCLLKLKGVLLSSEAHSIRTRTVRSSAEETENSKFRTPIFSFESRASTHRISVKEESKI